MYYKNANAVVMVYDVSNVGSFDSLGSWYQEIDEKRGADDLKIAVAANKCDMAEYQEVPMEQGIKYAKKIKAICMQTSAKDNEGIQELFEALALKLYAKHVADLTRGVSLQQNLTYGYRKVKREWG